jgi:ElaB/YqjD/DUF883 family membrane-anchored ribosome-binding protein
MVDVQGALTRCPKFRWLLLVFYGIASRGFIGAARSRGTRRRRPTRAASACLWGDTIRSAAEMKVWIEVRPDEDCTRTTDPKRTACEAVSLYDCWKRGILPVFHYNRIDVIRPCVSLDGSFFNAQHTVQAIWGEGLHDLIWGGARDGPSPILTSDCQSAPSQIHGLVAMSICEAMPSAGRTETKNETNTKESNMSATDRLVTDLKRIVRNSEELLHTAKDAVGDKAQEIRERLTDALDAAKRTCRDLEDKAIEGAKAADKTIRDHPYQSIGVAFGVGLLIGVLVTRK